jgi:hypothetical protein
MLWRDAGEVDLRLASQNDGGIRPLPHANSADFNRNLHIHTAIEVTIMPSPFIGRGNTKKLVGSDKAALRAQLKRDCKGVPVTILDSTASAYQIGGRGNVISKLSGKKTTFGQDFGK